MDRVIYRDYLVNRRFFIYCSLATATIAMYVGQEKTWRGLSEVLAKSPKVVPSDLAL